MLSLATSNIPIARVDIIGATISELFAEQNRIIIESVQREHGVNIRDHFPNSGFENLSTEHMRLKYFRQNLNFLVGLCLASKK